MVAGLMGKPKTVNNLTKKKRRPAQTLIANNAESPSTVGIEDKQTLLNDSKRETYMDVADDDQSELVHRDHRRVSFHDNT